MKARIHWRHTGGIELQYMQLFDMIGAPSMGVRVKLTRRVCITSSFTTISRGQRVGEKEGDGIIMQTLCLINQRNGTLMQALVQLCIVHSVQSGRRCCNHIWRWQSNWQHVSPGVVEPRGASSLVSYVIPHSVCSASVQGNWNTLFPNAAHNIIQRWSIYDPAL